MIPSNHEFLTAPRRTLRGGAKPQGGFYLIHYRVINGTAYQHPKFRLPRFQLVAPCPEDVPRGYVAAVAMDGKLHAQFKAETTARAWIRFMRGECFTHPQPEPRQA